MYGLISPPKTRRGCYSVISVVTRWVRGGTNEAQRGRRSRTVRHVAPRGGGPSSPASLAGRRNGAGFSNAAGHPVPSCSRQRNCASVATHRRHPAPGTPKRTAFNAAACGEGFVGLVGAMLAASPHICLTHASGTERLDCAHFVPTPGVQALFAVAIAPYPNPPKSLKTSNLAQLRAIVGNVSKLLILRGSLVRDQEVGGSNPLAPTIPFNRRAAISGVTAARPNPVPLCVSRDGGPADEAEAPACDRSSPA